MMPLFNPILFESAKTVDKFPCECKYCGNVFFVAKREILYSIRGTKNSATFCSRNCAALGIKK